MPRYPINKEFFPYSYMVPPLRTPEAAGKIGEMMKVPRWLYRDREISVKCESIGGYRGDPIELIVMEPTSIPTENCLIYYHGGGFFFEGAQYHYKNAKQYALSTPCKVIFVRYRLVPKNPFPIPTEDSYEALRWVCENLSALGISKDRIAIGGDSAGACLVAAVTQMARDRGLGINFRFQLLIYPFVDPSMTSESNKRFTDTPMWNSTLSERLSGYHMNNPDMESYAYASPIDGRLDGLPKAYIETAEFDSLHDDGVNYAKKLRLAGIAVELNETKGTMHAFDIAQKAPTTKAAIRSRISYMQKMFS